MRARPGSAALTEEQLRRMRESMPDLITDQFDAVSAAADGCDVILGGNAHQYAARSIAERRGIRYVTAVYAPVALPSPDHAPLPAPGMPWQSASADDNLMRWSETVAAWNARALERVNHNRARLGLSAICDVLRYNLTDHPWLAADVALAPVPATPGMDVFATGAWILADASALPQELDRFLAAGDPPIYLGFGSMPAPAQPCPATRHERRAVSRSATRGITDNRPRYDSRPEWNHPVDRPTYRFAVDDVDALRAEFTAFARPLDITPVSDKPWGTREFHLRDPDGNGSQFYRDLD